jgi:large subunit ribosomal protein L21
MNDYAIINSGSKQYKVSVGDIIRTERLNTEKGSEITFKASMVKKGDNVLLGNPILDDINIKGVMLNEGKAKKVIAFKMKRRKGERKKIGHRQIFSEVKIIEIP